MNDDIQGKLFKVGSAWAAIGITSWADVASLLAALYSAALFLEWAWKKVIKPMLVKRGFVKADRRRKDDHEYL